MTKAERSWIFYDWANSAHTLIIVTTILPIFFKNFAAKDMEPYLSTAYWGYGNFGAHLIGAVMAPVLGALADRRGRKKPYFAFFLAVGLLSTLLLVSVGEGAWFSCLLVYGLSVIGFTGANTIYDSFLVDVTEKKRMDWVSSCGYAWGYFGSTIPFLLSMAIIMKPEWFGLSSGITPTRVAFGITAGWWLVFSLPLLRNVRQVYFVEPVGNAIADSLRRLGTTLRNIRATPQVFLFLLAYFCYIDGIYTIIEMAVVYGSDVGIGSDQLMIILLVTQFVAFPFAILYGRLAKTFSAKNMILVGIVVYLGVTIFAYFIRTELHFWILAILVGTSQGGVQSLSRSFFGKIIPPERSAEFFGFYNIWGKFASIVGTLLVGLVTQLTGASRNGVLSLILLFIVGGLILLRVEEEGPQGHPGQQGPKGH